MCAVEANRQWPEKPLLKQILSPSERALNQSDYEEDVKEHITRSLVKAMSAPALLFALGWVLIAIRSGLQEALGGQGSQGTVGRLPHRDPGK